MKTNVSAVPTVLNHEGTPVKRLSAEQELRRAVSTFLLWEDSYYESGESTAERIVALIPKVPGDKVATLAIEARERMKLRHAPLLIVRELARLKYPIASVLERVIQRPDELAEFLALYWKNGRCPVSAQVKKGLALAFRKFNAYSLGKYNQDSAIKLRDVLFMVHAKPKDEEQAEAWKALVNGTLATPDTWEVALSGGADKKVTWERLLGEGKLGALALLRNLRNMQAAGVAIETIRAALKTANPERVLPFRFIAAAKYAPALEPELEALMFKALADTPRLGGRTALVIDTSPSMWQSQISSKSEMNRFEAAAALAMLVREVCEDARIYAFNHKGYEVAPRRGFGLRDALASTQESWSRGGLAVEMANRAGYDRIIVITDGQWHYSDGSQRDGNATVISPAPLSKSAYMVNVATYKNGVGYGKWTTIDGWSEAVLDFVRESENRPGSGL